MMRAFRRFRARGTAGARRASPPPRVALAARPGANRGQMSGTMDERPIDDMRAPGDPAATSDGRVAFLHIAAAAGEPMQGLTKVQAIAGSGLEGDRYATRSG